MELEHEAHVAVAEGGQTRVFEAGYVFSVKNDRSAVRAFETADYLQQGCLSGSARPHYGQHPPSAIDSETLLSTCSLSKLLHMSLTWIICVGVGR